MREVFEGMAIVLMLGCIAAASVSTFIFHKIIGWGYYPIVSVIIGSVIGIVILLMAPLQGVLAMILAAVGAFISAIVQEKLL